VHGPDLHGVYAPRQAVFREPRAATEVDATLAAYSVAIAESSAAGGALLLSVVGAKMSEVAPPEPAVLCKQLLPYPHQLRFVF